MIERSYKRDPDELRPIKFTRNFTKYAQGSVLVEFGETKVLVTAFIEEKTPKFLHDSNQGWITAEYSMLPGATQERTQRERFKVSGRTQEIQRLIGRAIRAAVDLEKLGERTITIDCDVIQADGGTRTASINGAFIAVYDALKSLKDNKVIQEIPIKEPIAAISVGIVDGYELLDLDYKEDSRADVDANAVLTASGDVIEFQLTSEGKPISQITLMSLLQLANQGIKNIIEMEQNKLDL
ncbi:MAG: ribonuclease PH [Cyanobacteriota bacterium]